MTLTNSYIFLNHPHRKKQNTTTKKNNETEISNINIDSVSLRLKKLFNITVSDENKHSWYKHRYRIFIEDCDIEIEFSEVKNESYLNITSTGKNKSQIIKSLEKIHKKILGSDIENDYIMFVSYDAISEYYCNKMYPKLNKLERNLKHLLGNIYILNFGIGYPNTTTNEELKKRVKRTLKLNGSAEKNEIELIKNFFYALNYGDVELLLFTKQLTSIDEKAMYDFINSIKPDDKFTGKEIQDIVRGFTPKSDWERLFKSKIPDDNIEKTISDIRKHRNNVAHCKIFHKDDYIKCQKLIAKLNKKILKAINITKTKDFAEKNRQELAICLSHITDNLRDFEHAIKTVGVEMAQIGRSFSSTFQSVRQKINPVLEGITSSVSEMAKPLKNLDFSQLKFLSLLTDQIDDDVKP